MDAKTVGYKVIKHIFIVFLITQSTLLFGQFQINGDATVISGDSFQLTPSVAWQSGAIWHKVQHHLDSTFAISGKIYFGNSEAGADGIAFVMQNNCLVNGSSGGGLGYENIPGASIGVEFDTHQNTGGAPNDPVFDHIALHQNGSIDHAVNLSGPVKMISTNNNAEDGLWHDFKITYDPAIQVISVDFDNVNRLTHTIDIKNAIFGGDPYVYWGFTSATGGLFANNSVYIETTAGIRDDTICSGTTTLTLPSLSSVNLALNQASNSSSNQSGSSGAPESDLPFDGNMATSWTSQSSDPQWVSVDLGSPKDIDSVYLYWESAYGSEYKIQTSVDNTIWTDQFHETAGDGGTDIIHFTANAVRYVRMYGIQRATASGYSLWEMEVYGNQQYAWTPNDGTISDTTSPSPIFSPSQTTTYSVTIPDQCLGEVTFDYTVFVSCTGVLGELSSVSNYEDCGNVSIHYFREDSLDNGDSLRVLVNYQGTAQNGVDYGLSSTIDALPAEFYLSPNQHDTVFDIVIDQDAQLEGTEDVQIIFETEITGIFDTLNFTIADFATNVISVELGSDTTIRSGDTVLLNSSIGGTDSNYTFMWIGDPNTTSIIDMDTTSTSAMPDETTAYILEIISTRGCVATDTILISVTETCLEQIPDAFTPDGDGVNDLWNIGCLSKYAESSIRVFNRWGSLVYESSGIDYTPWDGNNATGDGELPVGSYFYVIEGVGENFESARGKISLIR